MNNWLIDFSGMSTRQGLFHAHVCKVSSIPIQYL